ncbi:MAG: hypothetical protein ACI4MP_04445 [Candidatus Ventricola sp.]
MTRLESRVRACWRVRACAAGLCVGTQIFLFGTGVAMPIALGGAWIASLAALPMAALTAAVCRRALTLPESRGKLTGALYLLLALTLLASAAFALTALIDLAGQTLLVQARALWSTAVALAAVALCALTGGAARLCFALRFALPVLLLGLTALCVPMELPVGLFPIFGAGGAALGAAALCMLGAASPLLMLLLPPPELEAAGEAARRCPVPKTGFFLVRALTGAAVGVLLLFAASVCTTYEAIAQSGGWGERLRIVLGGQTHGSVAQTLLTLCQVVAMALLSVCMLASAEQALLRALPAARRGRAGLAALVLILAACMVALNVLGLTPALFAAPLLVVPTAALLILHKRMGGKCA